MNMSEIEDKIDSPYHRKEFRSLQNIEKNKLYKQLYNEGLLKSNNAYFSYNTFRQTITDIILDIHLKIEEANLAKNSNEEIISFLENGSSNILYLVIWYKDLNKPIEDIYKRAQRYNRLGAMV